MRFLVATLSCALVLLIPIGIPREKVPWQAEFDQKYATGSLAILNDGIYKIGPVSRTVTWFIGLLSQNTAKVSVKYMFVRCAGLDKVRFLSPKELVDLILMERARFFKVGDRDYEKHEKLYKEQCWSLLAQADRWHRYVASIKHLLP